MAEISGLMRYFYIEDTELLIRIIFSIILGSAIGLEREITNKSAGLRTQILVCSGSCIFTILSICGFSTAVTMYPIGDPARIAAQIVTGIGFIGAGTVLRQGLTIMGLTTASTLWMGAAIGMACGCGKISIAAVATIIAVSVLVLIRIIEFKLMPRNQKHMKKIKFSLLCSEDDYKEIYGVLEETFPDIIDFTKKTAEEDNLVKITAKIYCAEKAPVMFTNKKLSEIKNIHLLNVKEIFE